MGPQYRQLRGPRQKGAQNEPIFKPYKAILGLGLIFEILRSDATAQCCLIIFTIHGVLCNCDNIPELHAYLFHIMDAYYITFVVIISCVVVVFEAVLIMVIAFMVSFLILLVGVVCIKRLEINQLTDSSFKIFIWSNMDCMLHRMVIVGEGYSPRRFIPLPRHRFFIKFGMPAWG